MEDRGHPAMVNIHKKKNVNVMYIQLSRGFGPNVKLTTTKLYVLPLPILGSVSTLKCIDSAYRSPSYHDAEVELNLS